MKKEEQKDIKRIKNILSDDKAKDSPEFDILFIVDATGSMGSYIIAAKEETKNISNQLRQKYPDKMFQYGYIFYRDPIDSSGDEHEVIDLTDNVNSFPEKIGKIKATGGGDMPEDWAGAYKLANENISWRNGIKMIIHLTDAGAHGKLFTPYDKYPEEEAKLILQLEKCADKGIKIFGYVIEENARNSFNECSKIYRSKGGSFEIFDFMPKDQMSKMPMMNPMGMGKMPGMMDPMGMGKMPMMNPMGMGKMPGMMNPMGMGKMPGMMNPMGMGKMPGMMNSMGMSNMNCMMGMNAAPMMNMSSPMEMNNSFQANVNMNFTNNAMNNIQSILDKP